MQRTRSIQIYLKPDIEEEAILLEVWKICRKRSRPQSVFRRMLQEGLRSLIAQGELPPSIAREIADHPLLDDSYPLQSIPLRETGSRSRLAAAAVRPEELNARHKTRTRETPKPEADGTAEEMAPQSRNEVTQPEPAAAAKTSQATEETSAAPEDKPLPELPIKEEGEAGTDAADEGERDRPARPRRLHPIM